MLSWHSFLRTAVVAVAVAAIASIGLRGPESSSGPADVIEDSTAAVPPKAQLEEHAVPAIADKSADDVVAALPETTTESFGMVGVTWEDATGPEDMTVQVRTRTAEDWGKWQELHIEPSEGEGGRGGTEPLWVGKADGVAVKITSSSGEKPEDIKIATIDPGETGLTESSVTTAAYTTASVVGGSATALSASTAAVPQPAIILRSSWGATAGGTCDSPVYGATTMGAVIHHTAGNNTYTKSESASIVRATQKYHVDGRDWCDIGYNFLVDKYGQIFEGRKGGITKSVRAAHSGNDAVNQETMGVSLMGTFTSVEPSASMKTALTNLVSWRFAAYSIPAKGTYKLGGLTLNRIAGHRNVVSTECPGVKVYNWMSATGGLRDRVEAELAGSVPVVESVPVVGGLSSSGVTSSGATVSWNQVSTAVKYRVYVSTSSTMPSTCEPNCQVIVPSDLAKPSYKLSGLTSNATYYVKASAINSAGKTITDWQTTPLTVKTAPGSLPSATADALKRLQPGRIVVLGGTASVSAAVAGELAQFSSGGVSRSWGADRYATAAAVANSFAAGVDTVFVASGVGFADALAGAALAGRGDDPVLLTRPGSLPSATVDALKRLRPGRIVVLGGTASVSAAVATQLAKFSSGGVSRSWGADRYATAAAVANSFAAGVDTVFVASGVGFADALAGAPLAGRGDDPVLLTRPGSLPSATVDALKRLRPGRIVVLGGTASVSAAVATQLAKFSSGGVSRSWGADRYATAAAVANSFAAGVDTVFVASGVGFADAMTGAALAGRGGDPVLLAKSPPTAKAPSPSTPSANVLTVPSSRKFTLTGHGFGHGIGMSQYGAQGAATKGLTYDKILSYYYPGTVMGSKTGNIRVLISKDTDASVVVKARTGLAFRKGASNSVTTLPATSSDVKITQWQIIPKPGKTTASILQYYTTSWHTFNMAEWTGDAQFEASADPLTVVLPGGATANYRSVVRSALPKTGSTDRNTVNILSVENYVRGVVAAEMPSSWKPEALKAQTVAARTYGVRSLTASRYYDICDTTSCQVYRGVAAEVATTDAAVKATAGKILTYKGSPAFTQFSSSSGGFSALGSQPYLKAKVDGYDDWSGNSVHDWTKSVAASTLEKKYPTIGTLTSLTITKRTGGGDWGGRVSSLTLKGSKASKTITGNDARATLALRSNWFRVN